MRVAYCLIGIVGSVNYGMGLGKDIDYRLAHYWNKKNIFDINKDVDVFMHSWSVEHEDGLKEIYNPKEAIFEKQIDFGQETIRDNSIASRWYSTAICNQLRQVYEEEQGIVYDVVMFFRYDHVFLVPLDFSKFDMSYIWMRHGRPVGHIDGVRQVDNVEMNIDTTEDVDLSTHEARRNFNLYPRETVYDSFIFSNSKNIDIYSEIYGYLSEEDSDVWDKLDFCFFGETETEAIRALYKNPEHVDKEFDIKKFNKFENEYVRQNPEVIKRFKGTINTMTDELEFNDLDITKSGFQTEKVQ
jgi:hypothetical protein